MTRIVLISGKGGVGKTTVAAATGLAAAQRGYRTLVMSLDIAHSLSDSFDVERSLFDQNEGRTVRVAPNLDIQEIDVQVEISRHWTEVYQYLADLFVNNGVADVVAEEVALIPGTEDIIALMYVNQYVQENTYDLVVLDAPPTGESLRFVSIHSTLQWYMRKRFNLDRHLVKLAGPLLTRLADAPLPDDSYFAGLQRMFKRLEGVDDLLVDPEVTTVRLVTNAEKMVVRETQRAAMYFSLYGMTADQVIVNRMLPDAGNVGDYFAGWLSQQSAYVEEIREYFQPVPVATLPMFPQEVVGQPRLRDVAAALYGETDPVGRYLDAPPYRFGKDGGAFWLRLSLPFVQKDELEINRVDEDLIIRLGAFKRYIPLPRSVQRLKVSRAKMEEGELYLELAEIGSAVDGPMGQEDTP